jgi:chromate transporter
VKLSGAPYIERLNAEPRLRVALAAVTAAVAGVIHNLTVWFALQVLFARVGEWRIGPPHVSTPDPVTLSLEARAFGTSGRRASS